MRTARRRAAARMRVPIYQVDAFATGPFTGNPAAVCPLEGWLADATLQAIAEENNLSETAFLVPRGAAYELRWFTPRTEVDLCGHATLASAHVVLNRLQPGAGAVRFLSQSGELRVKAVGEDLLELDFPSRPPRPVAAPPGGWARALGDRPLEFLEWERDVVAVFESETRIRELRPEFGELERLGPFAFCCTAPGDEVDFVSRFFCPAFGILEDPVTGSAHCALTPYWAQRTGKARLRARQLSRRGGELHCEDRGERVAIAGRARLYLEGAIEVPAGAGVAADRP